MELVFNELSFLDHQNKSILLNNFKTLLTTFNEAQNRYGYTHIVFPVNYYDIQVTPDENFIQWINGISTSDKNNILSLLRRPFIDGYLEHQDEKLVQYYFVSEEMGIEQEYCDGLATADIMEIPAISLTNHPVWQEIEIKIFEETGNEPRTVFVKNISTRDSIENPLFIEYAESQAPLNLQVSTLDIAAKRIILREDHGIDKLQRLADRMVQNEYVNGVINSMPFNPHTSRFLRRINKNGTVEIVMHWDDRGIGMVIQTTGRNYRETKAIAEILRDQFDK